MNDANFHQELIVQTERICVCERERERGREGEREGEMVIR